MEDDKKDEPGPSGIQAVLPQVVQVNIPPPQPLDTTTPGKLAKNWKMFRRQWNNYEIATRLINESKEQRTATLLSCIGMDALEVFDGLDFADETQRTDIDIVLQRLEVFCLGETNEIYERFKFNKRVQEEGESVEVYAAALRSLAKTCNYGTLTDSLIRDKIVVGIRDDGVRRKLLRERALTLKSCLDVCRASECSTQQLKAMSQYEDVHAFKRKEHPQTSKTRPQNRPTTITCYYCGKTHQRKKEECPAWGKSCSNCHKLNHFASQCKSNTQRNNRPNDVKMVHIQSQYQETDDQDYALTVETTDFVHTINMSRYPKRLYAHLVINNQSIQFQLDCGATVNILPVDLYHKICNDPSFSQCQPTATTLVMFNKTEIKPKGKFSIITTNPKNNKQYTLEYIIVDKGYKPLLGAQTIQELQLMTVNTENLMNLDAGTGISRPEDDIIAKYTDIFTGEGTLQGKLHLELDESVKPVQMPVRKVPLAVKTQLKEEIDRLEQLGLLVQVNTPTDWISSIVVARKRNGNIRLCIDPRPLNKALKRNHYPLPVVEDLLPSMVKAKVFSVLDAKNGFWHVELDTESSYLTTFGTPWGRYRWSRMPFGLSPAPEEFQRRLDIAFEGLEEVVPIYDDTLVFGVGDTEAEALADHDRKLIAALNRCRERGIKLNLEKLKLRCKEVTFMGHVLSADGLKTDPSKVEAIRDMPAPANKQDVRRFLGTVNYLQKFAPNLADQTAILRDLLKEENEFQWSEQVQGQCFNNIKHLLSTTPVLKYFDPRHETELQCDASERGLGACLMQGGQPIAYASRALTPTEQGYAQIEKEMLAIVYGTEKFEQFIYGRTVKVETDHKPLESILRKSIVHAPKRLQRMMLRLQKFDLIVTYKKGTLMYLADTLSRAYLQSSDTAEDGIEDILFTSQQSDAAKDVQSIDMLQSVSVSEATLQLIKREMEADPKMERLRTTIWHGWPDTKRDVPESIREFFPFRDELSVQNGLVFKGERLVIPSGAKGAIIERVHASHIGVQGCLRRARETVYWPGMNDDVKRYVERCQVCSAHPQNQCKEPLISHEIPSRPWQKLGCDLFQQNGIDYLITVDYYSSFCEVDRLSTKTSKDVIGKLKQHLARHGLPEQLVSDNGPPFNSLEFQQFSQAYDFEHVTSSPGYPQSNGKVENAVKTTKRLNQKAVHSKSDPFLALLDWRNTPSDGLGSSPSQRLFNRRTRTLLPTTHNLLKPSVPEDVSSKLQLQKAKQALYFNTSARELKELKPGDTVHIKPLKPTDAKKPWVKAKIEGKVDVRSYQVRTEDGRVFRRNRRHLRSNRAAPIDVDDDNSTVPMATKVPTQTAHPCIQELPQDAQTEEPPDQSAPSAQLDTNGPSSSTVTTRSGRSIKRPTYLQDYEH